MERLKKKPLAYFLVISLSVNAGTLFYTWKNRADETPVFHPFIINYNVTEKSLLKNGYTFIPEDVPLLGKQIDDILIYYQLEYICEGDEIESMRCRNTDVYTRFCTIHLNSLDRASIIETVNRYDADIVGDFKIVNDDTYDRYDLANFFVRHRFTKSIFWCSLYKNYKDEYVDDEYTRTEDGYTLSIVTEFPWSKKKIQESRWIFNL
jgi:hypothetical protein